MYHILKNSDENHAKYNLSEFFSVEHNPIAISIVLSISKYLFSRLYFLDLGSQQMQWVVQRFPHTPHSCTAFPIAHIPHQ